MAKQSEQAETDNICQGLVATFHLGLNPFPTRWNPDTKEADFHPEHSVPLTLEERLTWARDNKANGIAYKTSAPWGAFDFDIKNTPNKKLFDEWCQIVKSQNEDIFRKI